jgi:hypothetical protein
MFKPNEELLLAIKESIPFQKAIKSVKVKDSGDDYVLTSSAKKKH